ncbi:MAG: sulfotransferase [Candidatus Thorarchaeota archaeon]
MKLRRTEKETAKQFDFPAPMYFIAKLVHQFPTIANLMNKTESLVLRRQMADYAIDRPIYVTGMARAGTTITLEMLSQHPSVATHRYLHMVLPYAPHFIQLAANVLPLMKSPVERLHKDRLLVTRDSPEAVEEIIWQRFFSSILDESQSNILDSTTNNPEFETFYMEHLRKLLFNQNATRYAAKNNYNASRLEYLQKMFPDVRFVIVVRNPFDHIASLAKQDVILGSLESADPRLLDWTKIIGHREFGSAKICINFGNSKTVEKIRNLWSSARTYAHGWAVYWDEVYSYLFDKLNSNSSLADASIVVRYEDLCEFPERTIDAIVQHVEIDSGSFRPIKEYYSSRLAKPTYYRTEYTEQEQHDILRETEKTASKFGYSL